MLHVAVCPESACMMAGGWDGQRYGQGAYRTDTGVADFLRGMWWCGLVACTETAPVLVLVLTLGGLSQAYQWDASMTAIQVCC